MTAELQIQLVEVLLKDNDSLTKALGAATQEKAELCRAVSHLEKTLKHHLLKGCALRVGVMLLCHGSAPADGPGVT